MANYLAVRYWAICQFISDAMHLASEAINLYRRTTLWMY